MRCLWEAMVALSFVACTPSALDTMVGTEVTARRVGEQTATLLREACVQRYAGAKDADAVDALDRVCLPAAKAFDAYRAAHLALVTAILAVHAGTKPPSEALLAAQDLAVAASRLTAAMREVAR